ncbi:hypothetical protein [Psychrobacter sp. 72-O-c]|uniref:hypothetical protein n=1 Tax=Psychrobacter sp. 72-O-c TaxID=2774125 RepID=UPI0019185E08|nr:hypothetical protein [Psychrobacter sp. 72-O-c]
MKDYKLLLIGLILLLLIVFIGVFTWLWQSNRKNIDPLPIMANEDANGQLSTNASEEPETIDSNILYIQAENKLQVPLDDVIISFEKRYPDMQVLARYVPTKRLLTLPDTSTSDNKPSRFLVNIDLIVADDSFTQTQLSPLQSLINEAQTKLNQSKVNANGIAQDDTANNEARNLASFSYALKGEQAVDGVILTDNPIAISFRNFLLSSVGQDILKKYDYNNIDGYKNSMDDLFNPTSRAKSTVGESSVNVADALSNGK